MEKFKIYNWYKIERKVSKKLTFIRKIYINEINKSEISGWQEYYYEDNNGNYLEGGRNQFTSKIRKATNKNYQITTSLLDEFKSTDLIH